ncbi:MAG: thioredoxin domain-containing protein [Myxococcales bacterium]|nr:thioredoxin domain-containing protein [Myxococcales bacterium]
MTDFSKLKGLYIALFVTTVVGLGLDVELTRLHYEVHTGPKKASYCTLNKTVDCAAVELSKYAVLVQVPMSAWAALFHLLVLGLVGWGLARKEAGFTLGVVALSALFGLGVSGYMAYISLLVLKKLCLLCTGLYAVAVIFALLSIVALKRAELGLLGAVSNDVKVFIQSPGASVPGLVVLIAMTGGLVVGYPKLYKPMTAIQPKKELRAKMNAGIEKGHPWIGPWTAKMKVPPVDIIEISDYECPYCRMFHLQLRNFFAGGKPLPVRLFHMNYPLGRDCNSTLRAALESSGRGGDVHKQACEAAKTALCALEQNKFWEVNDTFFVNQEILARGDIDLLLQKVDLDRAKLKSCVESDKTREKLESEMRFARKLGLMGTPTYVVMNASEAQCKLLTGKLTDGYCMLSNGLDPEKLPTVIKVMQVLRTKP